MSKFYNSHIHFSSMSTGELLGPSLFDEFKKNRSFLKSLLFIGKLEPSFRLSNLRKSLYEQHRISPIVFGEVKIVTSFCPVSDRIIDEQ